MRPLWFGRKLECVAKLAQFYIFWGRPNPFVLTTSVENNYIVWFECTDFHILINPFTTNPGYYLMYVGYIFARSVSSPHCDGVTIDPLLLNMKNIIFPLISSIILPKMLTLLYPLQPETLAVVYWNLYVVLEYNIEKWIDVSELPKLTCCFVGWHTCKTILFHGKCL